MNLVVHFPPRHIPPPVWNSVPDRKVLLVEKHPFLSAEIHPF